jgi:hypothetical protein
LNEARPTPYPELNEVLLELTSSVRAVLGTSLVGLYLQGSFAHGGFDEHSDVDFVAVTRGELSDAGVRALDEVHTRVYDLGSEWAKHLEGSYFPAEVLRTCDARGQDLWYLEHGDRTLIRSTHCNTAVVRWIVREHGVTLFGPQPVGLVDEVPADVLRAEVLKTMRDWGAEILAEPERFRNHFYQAFIVLSYCRMLHSLETGKVGSKREGAEWAKETLDASWIGLIDRTWSGRPDPATRVREPADPDEFRRTIEFMQYAIALAGQP